MVGDGFVMFRAFRWRKCVCMKLVDIYIVNGGMLWLVVEIL